MNSATARPTTASDVLLHPVALAALALWIVNDHVLKAAYPGWITGKLSDVASLIAFPLLAVTIIALWRERRGARDRDGRLAQVVGRVHLVSWVAATGFVMATINVFDGAAWAYRWGLGAMQWPLQTAAALVRGRSVPDVYPVELFMDASDLLTLPALIVPLMIAWPVVTERTPRPERHRVQIRSSGCRRSSERCSPSCMASS